MKKIFLLFAFLALTLFSKPLKASHMAGGNIHVQQLDTLGTYIVYLTVYRDCNGIGLSYPILHAEQNNTILHDTLNSSNLIRVTDITGIGDSCTIQTRCNGGSFYYGIEAYLFADTIDLSGFQACEVAIYYDSYVNRLSPINGPTPPYLPFFVAANINKCMVNSTPYFLHQPTHLIGANQNLSLSYAAADTADNGDSISYELTTPLTGLGSYFTYTGQFTYLRPMTFLGFPIHTLPLPGGYHINPNTGLLQFRPTQANQVAWVAVRVKEWRKINGVSTVISQITQDLMYIVINKPQQTMPVANNLSAYDEQADLQLCSQDTFRMSLDIQDADGDSVFVRWDSLPNGANLSVTHDSNSAAQIEFTWYPGAGRVRTQPYLLNLELRDQACPIANKSYRTYRLFVHDSIPAPQVNVGPDTMLWDFSANLRVAASISNQLNRAVRWTSSGDGHFNRSDTLYPTYIPGTNDKNSCQYSLYCEVLDFGCGGPGGKWIDTLNVIRQYDSLYINAPSAYHFGDTVQLNLLQTPPVKQFLGWRTLGDGSFDDSSKVQAKYTPGSQDWANCSWTILADFQYTGCTVVSDTQHFQRLSNYDYGLAPQQALRGDTIYVEAYLTANSAGSVYWTSLGNGILGDSMASQTWYLPGTQDYANCQSYLQVREWPLGSCFGLADSFTIQKETPAWKAGLSQQLNYGDTAFLQAQPSASSTYQFGYWTSSGDGHFTDSNDANSAYILGTQDWASCVVGIYWNEIDPDCGGRTDSLALVRKSTSIDAGVDLVAYFDSSMSYQLQGWSDTANGITAYWKTLGDGTFSDTLDLNAVYTPGPNDGMSCGALLSLIEYPQGSCTNFDGIRVEIQDSAEVFFSATVDSTTFDTVFFHFQNPGARYVRLINAHGSGTTVILSPYLVAYVLSAADKQDTLVVVNGLSRSPCGPDSWFGANIHPQMRLGTGVLRPMQGVGMYPNPNKGTLKLSFTKAPSHLDRVEVFAADGKQVEVIWELKEGEMELKLKNPIPGIYMLRVLSDNSVYNRSFTVQP
ncbi:MAG: T9SS type A sorting domain-containing protein [Bacteroidetes bacterium]|nr:MAG: T9SS type A sorting domain-containing protein [Bacteroidota bacterium]